MSNRRIVVEHPDGRRLTIRESEYDVREANPLNHAHASQEWNADRGETILSHHAAKPVDDWESLKADGFVPYSYIHGAACDRSCTHDTDVVVHEGAEIKLEQ